jgi:uncharacterized repeat protein (TIGR01451 family)
MIGRATDEGVSRRESTGVAGDPRGLREPSARRMRWLRGATIAVAAIILASCRSLTVPVLVPLAGQLGGGRHAFDASGDGQSAAGPSAVAHPVAGVEMATPDATPAAVQAAVQADSVPSTPVSGSTGSDLWPAARGITGRRSEPEPARADPDAGRPVQAAVAAPDEGPTFLLRTGIEVSLDEQARAAQADEPRSVVTTIACQTPAGCLDATGCEPPCPPLPRRGGRHCRPAGGCRACGERPAGECGAEVCLPLARAVPAVGPYLVCDGGDCLAPARPVGRSGIVNLTAGDTVARYRADDSPPRRFGQPAEAAGRDGFAAEPDADAAADPADAPEADADTAEAGVAAAEAESRIEAASHDGDEACEACLAVSNCACVYSPRFASVREIIRPLEEASPVGPGGLAADTVVEADVGRQPVWGSTQRIAPEAARKAQPGVAVEERLPPLAVDQAEIPHAEENAELPAERIADDQPEALLRTQRPLLKVGFDVPMAWTCVRAANVLLNDQTPDVISADRGTATLRFEEPGRCELTLCKRSGSDTARIGEELDFTIYLLNSGDRPLTDIVLVDALPRRLELLPKTAASSLTADFTTETGDDGSVVLKWRFTGTLQPGEAGFVRFRTVVR